MPAPPPSLPDVVARLRAAGCVFAEEEAALVLAEGGTPREVEERVRRRESGVPLEHVLGWAAFCGLRVAVDPGVFVPRRRTELLVRTAARLVRERPADGPLVVVDLCCGSGALGLALVTLLGGGRRVELHAADVDPAAVVCAARNLAPVGGRAHQGDLVAALPADLRGRVDVLLANVPYVPTGELASMPPEARDHEPRVALDGGEDGLGVLRRVVAAAPGWLAPGGHLLSEASERQAPAAVAAFEEAGLAGWTVADGDLDATGVVGRRP